MNITYIISRVLKKMRLSSIKNSEIDRTSQVESGSHIVNSSMDKHSFCGYDCKIYSTRIGKYCSIADNVSIGLPEHPLYWVSTSPVFYKGKDSIKKKYSLFERNEDKLTIIENDVWIGDGVLIKGGVTISNGAVIGMGSVLTKNVGPYEIWAGNPAKLIKKRFDEETIDSLLSIEWWNMDEDIIAEKAVYIREPKKFIGEMK